MNIIDILITTAVILIPSWTVAYITDKVVYVIPMLAVTTFIVAQVMQHRNNRRLDKDEGHHFKKKDDVHHFKKKEDGMKDGMKDDGHEG